MCALSFDLQSHLDGLYTARSTILTDEAQTQPELEQPQAALRAKVARLLGLENRAPTPVVAELLQVDDRGSYREETISLDVGEQVRLPVVVLVPHGKPPFKPIIVFHGHEPGVEYVLGHYPDEATARENLAIDNNYAQALAQAGYLVCAVEQRGLGKRLTGQRGDGPFARSCRHLAFAYMSLGRTLIGERCWDGMHAIDYLQTRPEAQTGILGCTGHSGGGCTALWLAALDARITATVVSGYFCSFRDSILAMPHCECNYVPGILELSEMGDIAALIAPRPLRIIHGQDDPIFPIRGTQEQFETVRRAYAGYGCPEACSLAIHPGGHAYHHADSQAWFEQWL